MNIEIKTLRPDQFASTKKGLYDRVQSLSIAQSNGHINKSTKAGVLYFPNVNERFVPLDEYLSYINDEIVEVTDYNLFIYAPKSFLDTDVFDGLPMSTKKDGSLINWRDWTSKNYSMPLHENDTHVIILCQGFHGGYLTSDDVKIIIDNLPDGSELMGIVELEAKIKSDFKD